jgi:hypothetical protein
VDLGDLLGGLDVGDAKKALGFVLDNQDDFGRLLQLVKDLPDDIVGFLGQLPQLLETVGDGLAEAGEQAAQAAHALVGDDGKGGAKGALAGGADVMSAAKDQLAKAAGLLSGLAGELHDIGIPSIEPKYTKVAGINVISGVDVASHKLLEGPAKTLTEGADTVNGVAGNLGLLTGSMRELSDILGSVGAALAGLGEKLSGSGASVRTLLAR